MGATLHDAARGMELARRTPGLTAAAGVHPHDAKSGAPAAARRWRELLADRTVVAVGETGLDYHYDHSPRDAQGRAVEAQLGIAAELGKPIGVHAREADDDVAAVLRAAARGPVVLHSFSSGTPVFDAGMEVGAYFSFSGMITFKSWTLADRLSACPPERLLIETDAPYLAPVPHRGSRNEPAFVREVAAALARARGETVEALGSRTTANPRHASGPRPTTTPYPSTTPVTPPL